MFGMKSRGKNWKVDVIIYQTLSENYAEAGHGGMIRGLIRDKVKASHRAIGVFARTDEVVYIKIDSPKKNKKQESIQMKNDKMKAYSHWALHS